MKMKNRDLFVLTAFITLFFLTSSVSCNKEIKVVSENDLIYSYAVFSVDYRLRTTGYNQAALDNAVANAPAICIIQGSADVTVPQQVRIIH
ncbi:MAG: hypothetical protein ABFS28_03815 [Bacteroidota bacterium]